ncbi:TRM11 family SAM-dependent methyltransferase [Paenactinomyces guangxiensis]|uniref:Methyltransferase domain-containing protein n=1 Tax=Paenactinomyces guangxiensis TaxID=1490290 RepID=A0A7W2A9E7_9BACL|nr:methyltransferase domain-containing protein [Paenactinomyces guangxiensis]MBA4495169.1 methyltransferase domain-containing protein [Paenactinomyces guangxiensis]MBH8592147.1 methyltransferase domain-containing protein [Paenactinomyces guangxiensis]
MLPTVAHAMVWLSDPQPTDTFVDLCCGSGTILSERVVYPANQIIGGDISSTITMLAKENLYYANVQVNVWDARKTPLNSNSVNKVVTNLPFGRQISIDEDIRSFKHHVMKEISRILIPNGTAVILSESTHQILEEAERFGFSCLKSYPLSLKGLHPALFVLEKRNTL